MNNYTYLSAGQREVVDAYLQHFVPATSYNRETDILHPTDSIAETLSHGCDMNINVLADYLQEHGYHYHFDLHDCVGGWILREAVTGAHQEHDE